MEQGKRKSAGLEYDEPSKRPRRDAAPKNKGASQGRVDPTYGQRSAFPGLDEYSMVATEDDDLAYDDDAEALMYLQTVRSEAGGIPSLLVAPRRVGGEERDMSMYDDGVGDSRGFYSDGAYTAAPLSTASPAPSMLGRSPRDVYFERVLERYSALREQLGQTPPHDAIQSLSKDHTSYMSASAEDYRKWRWCVANTEPQMAQLAGMDKASVLRLVRLMANDKNALGGKAMPTRRLSRWLWGVLARVPHSGELGSEEVGIVRDLGKRAVWVGVQIGGLDTSQLDDGRATQDEDEEIVLDLEVDDAEKPAVSEQAERKNEDEEVHDARAIDAEKPPEEGTEGAATRKRTSSEDDSNHRIEEHTAAKEKHSPIPDEDPADLATARTRLLSRLDGADGEAVPGDDAARANADGQKQKDALEELLNAKATIDMVITIAGEVYGQRDLLEFREKWE